MPFIFNLPCLVSSFHHHHHHRFQHDHILGKQKNTLRSGKDQQLFPSVILKSSREMEEQIGNRLCKYHLFN